MTATTLACLSIIILPIILAYVVIWALARMSAKADEQNEAMKRWNERRK